jgi:hypothetical protein
VRTFTRPLSDCVPTDRCTSSAVTATALRCTLALASMGIGRAAASASNGTKAAALSMRTVTSARSVPAASTDPRAASFAPSAVSCASKGQLASPRIKAS